MPDKTGISLIKDIVEISLDAPIIVLTGYVDLTFGVKSLSLGVADYILKDELTALSLYKSIVYSTERKRITSALESSERRVRNFAKQLNNLVEEERARIAREIHDEFGQQLSGLKMSLSSLRNYPGVSDKMAHIIDDIVIDVNNGIQSLRQIANDLRPVLIDKLGLFPAIKWLADDFKKKSGITVRVAIDLNQPVIDKMLEINIFRICQEALTNISKHAMATMVNISTVFEDGKLIVRIIDNGKGFKTDSLHNPLSMGLLNMEERANLTGAKLNINSTADKGTTVELTAIING